MLFALKHHFSHSPYWSGHQLLAPRALFLSYLTKEHRSAHILTLCIKNHASSRGTRDDSTKAAPKHTIRRHRQGASAYQQQRVALWWPPPVACLHRIEFWYMVFCSQSVSPNTHNQLSVRLRECMQTSSSEESSTTFVWSHCPCDSRERSRRGPKLWDI